MKKLRIKELHDGSKPINYIMATLARKIEDAGYTPDMASFEAEVIVDVDELRGDSQVVKQVPSITVCAVLLSYEEDDE